MQLILTTLNSKYIHTNLALRTLKANSISKDISTVLVEYSINDHLDDILGNLYNLRGDVYAFSCYIWNIEQTLKVVNNLKQVLPDCTIILGGPEVSFHSTKILKDNLADIVVKGEGESTFKVLLQRLRDQTNYENLKGIAYKKNCNVFDNGSATPIKNMDDLTFAYHGEDMSKYKNQILYYEGSRGCPFSCSYCLSSVDKNVRMHSLNRVQNDLSTFIQNNVKQVKFVDRTFNCNLNWAKSIIKFLIDNNNHVTNFHFEIAADLLDDDIIEVLNSAPVGLLQLEIGVQTINDQTLTSINRKTSINKIEENIAKLRLANNIHIHLDLIAGLPYEDIHTFESSFNRVFAMDPHMLQLGFLKLLKGSPIEMEREKYQYRFLPYPPYEILSNKFISYKELLFLKKIENLVDKYNNSGAFKNTIEYILTNYYPKPFSFFKEFVQFWEQNNLFRNAHNKDKLYEILLDFTGIITDDEIMKDLIKLDYLSFVKFSLPTFITSSSPSKEAIFKLLKNESFITKYLPQHVEESAKKLFKQIHIEIFHHNFSDLNHIKKEKTTLLFYKSKKVKIDQINEYVILQNSVFDALF